MNNGTPEKRRVPLAEQIAKIEFKVAWAEDTVDETNITALPTWRAILATLRSHDTLQRDLADARNAFESAVHSNAELQRDLAAALERVKALESVLDELEQGVWQFYISTRKRPTLDDMHAIWLLAKDRQPRRAALSGAPK